MTDIEKNLSSPIEQAPNIDAKKENATNSFLDAGELFGGMIELVISVASSLDC
jgi:hypothetical protein